MLSLTTRAFLEKNQVINFKIPENIKLKSGEYEIVVVINTVPLTSTKKKKLTFSEHNYCFENPNSTFSRADIYEDYDR